MLLRSTTPCALGSRKPGQASDSAKGAECSPVPVLQAAQFGDFFFTAADQAGFLELQIADLLFAGDEGVGVDQVRAGGQVLFAEQLGEFDAAFGEDRGSIRQPGNEFSIC